MAPLRIPLVTNVDAGVITSGDEAREALVRQVTLPVRWEESMRELIEQGTTTFVEVGPGPRAERRAAADRALGALRQRRRLRSRCRRALERLVQAQGEAAEAS